MKRSIVRQRLAHFLLTLAVASAFVTGCPRGTSRHGPRTIVIATLMSHPSLDQVSSGTRQELTRQGFVEGRDVRYVMRNANGQQSLLPTIAAEIAALQPAVTVSIGTPMSQAVVRSVQGTIVFSAVTDPVSAGIVRDISRSEPRITGVSDAWPYEVQLRLIREILPTAHRLGVLYNPGESAGQYGARRIRELAPRFGFEVVEGPVSTSMDVATVAAALAPRVDVLYPSSDNTVISGIAGAIRVSFDQHKPLIGGELGTVEHGGLAAASVGYTGVGRETGALVARVLRGEDRIPVVVASDAEVLVNTRAAAMLGVTLPPAVLSRAVRVITSIQ